MQRSTTKRSTALRGRKGFGRDRSAAGALAMLAPRPTAGPALAFLQLFSSTANTALSGCVLFGVLDPADELVTCQRGDVFPRGEHLGVGDQCLTQVLRQLVHHSAGYSLA